MVAPKARRGAHGTCASAELRAWHLRHLLVVRPPQRGGRAHGVCARTELRARHLSYVLVACRPQGGGISSHGPDRGAGSDGGVCVRAYVCVPGRGVES
eukprot:555972-Pelagomonas_calceolata.AAC.8